MEGETKEMTEIEKVWRERNFETVFFSCNNKSSSETCVCNKSINSVFATL